MSKRLKIYSFVAGLVFIISGIAKSLNVAAFANIITQYGFERLRYLAPGIVLLEVLLGLLLVFRIKVKTTAWISALFVGVLTLVFSYGLFFHGIEDCGCFGKIAVLNTSPLFTYIRNILLIYLLIAVWRRSENNSTINKWSLGAMVVVLGAVTFISGYTSGSRNKKISTPNQPLNTHRLNEFISTSNDSTYLVVAFTYACPHCLNSILNLKQYAPSGTVDKVIGLVVEDAARAPVFQAVFNPNFSITGYPEQTLHQLSKKFPTAWYIRNDSILAELSGELPCSYVFRETVLKGK